MSITASATTYTIGYGTTFNTAAKMYQFLEGQTVNGSTLACGDTVNIAGGTYNSASSITFFRVRFAQVCTAGSPLTIQAQDMNNLPIFDYSGHPLDGNGTTTNCTGGTPDVPGDYTGGDCNKGAWQFSNTQYITIRGLRIEGQTANNSPDSYGLRITNATGMLVTQNVIIHNAGGIKVSGIDNTFEYNVVLSDDAVYDNGQTHNLYDIGSRGTIIRYNYFCTYGCVWQGVTYNCCIALDGSVSASSGAGQNLHLTGWDSQVYGNWLQNAGSYQFDLMGADPTYARTTNCVTGLAANATSDQCLYFYNNVVVNTQAGSNPTKLMTTLTDEAGRYAGAASLYVQWNTIILGPLCNASWGGCSWVTGAGYGPSKAYASTLFQTGYNGNTSTSIHYSNNVLYANAISGCGAGSGCWATLFQINEQNSIWTIDGTNNWVVDDGSSTGANGTQKIYVGCPYSDAYGSCSLSSTTAAAPPAPFTNLATLDLSPNAAGAFGSADTTQTLKSPISQTSPTLFVNRSSYTDVGAIQYGSPTTTGSIQTTNTIRTANTVMQ